MLCKKALISKCKNGNASAKKELLNWLNKNPFSFKNIQLFIELWNIGDSDIRGRFFDSDAGAKMAYSILSSIYVQPEHCIIANRAKWVSDKNLRNYKYLYVPDSVTVLPEADMPYLLGLKSIIVSKNNPQYSTYKGALYNKDLSRLIVLPDDRSRKTYVIPDTVKEIDNAAINGGGRIVFPDCFQSISDSKIGRLDEAAILEFPGKKYKK